MAADDKSTPPNPLEAARRLTAPVRQRRFYAKAEMTEEEGGFVLRLDGKRAMTPGKNPLGVPHRHLAEAIAAEWTAQGEFDRSRRRCRSRGWRIPRSTALRRGSPTCGLTCSPMPAPIFSIIAPASRRDWSSVSRRCGIQSSPGPRGVLAGASCSPRAWSHVAQPEPTLAAIAAAIERFDDPFRLAGLSLATSLSGSALIALALAEGALDVDAAWAAAHVDEDWNIEKWGEDAEAMARRAKRLADFRAAALALRLRSLLPEGEGVAEGDG